MVPPFLKWGYYVPAGVINILSLSNFGASLEVSLNAQTYVKWGKGKERNFKWAQYLLAK